LDDGIECFTNGEFDASKNIFSRIIEKQQQDNIIPSDLDKLLSPYIYLSFLEINNNENSADKIKSIYFIHPDFNIEMHENAKNKHIKEFNKYKVKINNEKIKDIITQSNFIYICNNNCNNNRNNNGFWIGEKEISEKEWHIFSSSKMKTISENPIRNITWENASNFSILVKKRLCRREEWIQALQKGKGSSYATNSIIFINSNNNKRNPTSPSTINKGEMGTTGVYNLIGNVSEFITIQGEPGFIGLYWGEMVFNEDEIIYKIIKNKIYLEKKSSDEKIGVRLCHSY
jgi:hypothetical protein